jgi:hypothetical protein
MGTITVEVWDHTGNKRKEVELPDDAPVNRVIYALVDRLGLPRNGPDGSPLSYKFHNRTSGKQLQDTLTIADAGVREGHTLVLQPEITAGCAFFPK